MPLIPLGATLLRFARAIWAALKDPQSRDLVLFTGLIVLSGAWFYHIVEGWAWLDAVYFCVITLTTVGYGDLAPTTPLGKLFTIVYIIVGLGLLLSFINLVATYAQRPLIPRRGPKGQPESPLHKGPDHVAQDGGEA